MIVESMSIVESDLVVESMSIVENDLVVDENEKIVGDGKTWMTVEDFHSNVEDGRHLLNEYSRDQNCSYSNAIGDVVDC